LRQFTEIADVDNVYDPRIFQVLDEGMMNCKFNNLTKVSSSFIETISSFLPYVYQEMVKKYHEERERSNLIGNLSDTNQLREV